MVVCIIQDATTRIGGVSALVAGAQQQQYFLNHSTISSEIV
jgi:hypothetical protein